MRLPADFTVRLTHCGYFAFSVEYSDQLLNYTIVGNVEECTDTPKLVEKFWTVTRKNTSPCEHCPYWSVGTLIFPGAGDVGNHTQDEIIYVKNKLSRDNLKPR